MRVADQLAVSDGDDDRVYTSDQVIAAMEGLASNRTTYTATYSTPDTPSNVYYTALDRQGGTVTTRRTSGVYQLNGLYAYDQPTIGVAGFQAIWDEGDPDDYVDEWIEVPR